MDDPMPTTGIRDLILNLPSSEIRDVSEIAADVDGLIALWFGESDEPTPAFIKQAAIDSLARDETFYTSNSGVAPLRQAIMAYMARVYGGAFERDRITVTASGMHAIAIATQALIDPGDNAVVVGPVWPNVRETVHIMGGTVRDIYLQPGNDGWRLDLDAVIDRCDGATKLIFINSPGNPTGWMMTTDEQRSLLDFCRGHGIWIVCDDVYARVVYDRDHAQSFIELAEPEDRVLAINSFSKSWSMTGWRLGWITAPVELVEILAKITEFNIAGPTTFVQHAGITALTDGDDYVAQLVAKLKRRRDLICQGLAGFGRVTLSAPDAAFYAFFHVDGLDNSFDFAVKLAREARVGLAPGSAFGPAGQGHLRLCFASSDGMLEEALNRLRPFLD
jgi:aspartate/methionine/tyrosine aminotransferase